MISPPLLTVEYPIVPGFENSDPQQHYWSCHSASKLLIRDPIEMTLPRWRSERNYWVCASPFPWHGTFQCSMDTNFLDCSCRLDTPFSWAMSDPVFWLVKEDSWKWYSWLTNRLQGLQAPLGAVQDSAGAAHGFLQELTIVDMRQVSKKWHEHLLKCIRVEGDHVNYTFLHLIDKNKQLTRRSCCRAASKCARPDWPEDGRPDPTLISTALAPASGDRLRRVSVSGILESWANSNNLSNVELSWAVLPVQHLLVVMLRSRFFKVRTEPSYKKSGSSRASRKICKAAQMHLK